MSAVVGLRALRGGFSLAASRELRRFVWLPIVVSFVLVAALLATAFHYVQQAVAWVVSLVPDWLAFIEPVVAAVFYLAGLLAGGWMLGFIAIIVASPFFGELSARAETAAFGDGPVTNQTFGQAVRAALHREWIKLRYHLPRLVLVVLVSLLFTPIAPILWFGFGAWMIAVQFTDFAGENRELDFSETLSQLRANRAATLTYGGATAFLMSIPFVNVFVIPAAVCGGAILWRNLDEMRQAPADA